MYPVPGSVSGDFHNPVRLVLLTAWCHRSESWGSEKLSELPQVTQWQGPHTRPSKLSLLSTCTEPIFPAPQTSPGQASRPPPLTTHHARGDRIYLLFRRYNFCFLKQVIKVYGLGSPGGNGPWSWIIEALSVRLQISSGKGNSSAFILFPHLQMASSMHRAGQSPGFWP